MEARRIARARVMKRGQFTHQWVTNLLEAIDGSLNPETTMRLMESCGRACARSAAVAAAAECGGDLDRFLATLRRWVGKANVTRDDTTVTLVYDRCYCTQQAELPPRLGATFCSCSRGWLLEMFEKVLGRPVEVEMTSSIRGGSDRCRFVVHL